MNRLYHLYPPHALCGAPPPPHTSTHTPNRSDNHWMFREFFCSASRKQRAVAWSGLLVFVGHAVFKAYLKAALNGWYGRFYDLLQEQVTASTTSTTDTTANMTLVAENERLHLQEKRSDITELLIEFCWIVAPSLVIHPVSKFIGSCWKFSWRVALVKSYLAHTDVNAIPVPNAAQRVHEDTMRFEAGIYAAVSILLDSFLTLCVFIPILLDCGRKARPEWMHDWMGDSWLVLIAVQSAVYGVSISAFIGRRLVDLEVQNQDVEAKLRTKLVLLEQMPTAFVEDSILVAPDAEAVIVQAHIVDEHNVEDPEPRRAPPEWNPLHAFLNLLRELWQNYKNLFIEFAKFNSWVALFDQALIITPYILTGPLMYSEDPLRRITLGTLTKVSNSFDKVFSSLSVVAESWADINDFRSTVRRLRLFEQKTYARRAFRRENVYSKLVETRTQTRTPPPRPLDCAVEL